MTSASLGCSPLLQQAFAKNCILQTVEERKFSFDALIMQIEQTRTSVANVFSHEKMYRWIWLYTVF